MFSSPLITCIWGGTGLFYWTVVAYTVGIVILLCAIWFGLVLHSHWDSTFTVSTIFTLFQMVTLIVYLIGVGFGLAIQLNDPWNNFWDWGLGFLAFLGCCVTLLIMTAFFSGVGRSWDSAHSETLARLQQRQQDHVVIELQSHAPPTLVRLQQQDHGVIETQPHEPPPTTSTPSESVSQGDLQSIGHESVPPGSVNQPQTT